MTYTNTTFGSVAVYSCAVGYRLAGNNTRVCQPNGTWTGVAPSCISTFMRFLFTILHGKEFFLLFHLVVTCHTLPELQNKAGSLAVSYFNGKGYSSAATYRCDNFFYYLVGHPERVCNADGNWTGVEPHCESMSYYVDSLVG